MLIGYEQRCKHQRGLLRQQGQQKAAENGGLFLPVGARVFCVDIKSQETEECRFQVRNGGYPIDDFRVDGMNGEENRCKKGSPRFSKQLATGVVDTSDDERVQQDIQQMIAYGQITEGLPYEQIGQ